MRKLFSILLALCVIAGTVYGQADPSKTIKAGTKALAKYQADPSDKASLMESRQAGLDATAADASLAGAWMLLADSYAAEVNSAASEVSQRNAEWEVAKLTAPDAPAPRFPTLIVPVEVADQAVVAYQKAYASTDKSSYKKKAKDGMVQVSSNMGMMGNAMLSSQRYVDSYGPLKAMTSIDKFLRENNEEPIFKDEAALNSQKYITAVVAQQAGDKANARKLFQELYEADYAEPAVYAAYSNMLMEEGDTKAGLAALDKGREKFPENSEILFAEINYYIKNQDYATLEQKLQLAIAKEPDNVGLYTTLGNVYMNLGGGEQDATKSQAYYDQSMEYFQEAMKRDEKNVDAVYSIGSMYYNKAVAKNTEMNNLSTSKADQVKYEVMEKEVTKLFEQALPYFEKAIAIDAKDRNTIIALKEIYARQGQYEKSKLYKERLEAMGG